MAVKPVYPNHHVPKQVQIQDLRRQLSDARAERPFSRSFDQTPKMKELVSKLHSLGADAI